MLSQKQKNELIVNPPAAAKMWSKEEWEDIVMNELFAIDCNDAKGPANGFYGLKHTRETKDLISSRLKEINQTLTIDQRKERFGRPANLNGMFGSSRTGEANPMWGKTHSSESLEKMRLIKLGKKMSSSAKKKMSESQKNRWTAEAKSARSEQYKAMGIKPPSAKGMKWYNNGTKCIRSKEHPGGGWNPGRLKKNAK